MSRTDCASTEADALVEGYSVQLGKLSWRPDKPSLGIFTLVVSFRTSYDLFSNIFKQLDCIFGAVQPLCIPRIPSIVAASLQEKILMWPWPLCCL